MDDKKKELDKFKWSYKKEIRKELRIGSLILAQPFLNDEVFKRSVCLLCAHSRKEGSFGFILNKPTEFKVGDFIEELEDLDLPVYFGGPVATDSLYFLHDNSLQIEDAQKVIPGVYWGGDFQQMAKKLSEHGGKELNVKFILGYSGWDPGQLRKEIIEDSWIVAQANPQTIFEEREKLWKDTMEGLGEIYNHMANLPERPELN